MVASKDVEVDYQNRLSAHDKRLKLVGLNSPAQVPAFEAAFKEQGAVIGSLRQEPQRVSQFLTSRLLVASPRPASCTDRPRRAFAV